MIRELIAQIEKSIKEIEDKYKAKAKANHVSIVLGSTNRQKPKQILKGHFKTQIDVIDFYKKAKTCLPWIVDCQ